MDEPKAFDLVQSAISRLESLTDEDWKRFRPGPQEVFAPDGDLNPPELQRVVEQSGFVGPPNWPKSWTRKRVSSEWRL